MSTVNLPAMINGWTILGAWRTGPNGTWKVNARRGGQVVSADRLTLEQVAAFDPDQYWNAR